LSSFEIGLYLFIIFLFLSENIPKLRKFLDLTYTLTLMTVGFFVGEEYNIAYLVSLATVYLLNQDRDNSSTIFNALFTLLLFKSTSMLELFFVVGSIKTYQVLITRHVSTNHLLSILFYILLFFISLVSIKMNQALVVISFLLYLYFDKNLMHIKENIGIKYLLYLYSPFIITNFMATNSLSVLSIYLVPLMILIVLFEVYKVLILSKKAQIIENLFLFSIYGLLFYEVEEINRITLFLLMCSVFTQKYILNNLGTLKYIFSRLVPYNPIFLIMLFVMKKSDLNITIASIILLTLFGIQLFAKKKEHFIQNNYQIHDSYILNFTAASLSILFIIMAITVKIFL